MSNKKMAAASIDNKPITFTSLFEAAVAGRWEELSSLCDQYSHPHNAPLNPNPLFAAVLHTAVFMAAKHQSITIFSDVAPREIANTAGLQLSIEDFCPYLTFDEEEMEQRSRRKAIAKLCRVNPKWISNPLVGTSEKNADTEPVSGATCLHLAVRMRCPALVKLLLKYCPTSAQVQDDIGYLPLHYAVRPVDEIQVYKKAIAMHKARTSGTQSGLVPPSDIVNRSIPTDAGGGAGGGVSFGMRMVNRGKQLLCGNTEVAMLSRFRVHSQISSSTKRKKCIATKRKHVSAKISASTPSKAKEVHNPTRRSSRIKKNDEIQQAKALEYLLFSNLYSSPSSLVRAIMYLGCIEEDSDKFIAAESEATSEADYPLTSSSRGLMRASRPWKKEAHRLAVVTALTDVYPEGMAVACNHDEEAFESVDWNNSKTGIGGGGDTPFIIAVRTFKSQVGDDDDDEDFNMNMMNMEGGGNGNELAPPPGFMGGFNHENPAEAAAAPNENENAVEETGEEDADYEADLPAKEDVGKTSDEKPPADAGSSEPPAEQNGNNNNDQPPVGNNQEEEPDPEDPLESIRIMVAAARRNDDFASFLTANDDGDTPMHMATRIGVNRRLVSVLLSAFPASASMRAKDNCTPLHLILRRCSHLAPEGVGGLATYDADTVQLMIVAAGRDPMCWFNNETRTPMHEACYYGASPEVLELMAIAEGGRDAMLMRDSQGHTPLGAYCRHAADFYGMRVLVNHCPQAAAAMADGRRLPIHRVLAAFNLAVNVDVLNLLGRAYPRGVYAKDSHGMTPLALLGQSYKGPMNVDLPKLHANRTTLGRW
jgi:ankyrin repeat protein